MFLSRHLTPDGPRWALDGNLLPSNFSLGLFLQLSPDAGRALLDGLRTDTGAYGPLLAPVEPAQEVWAAGVTYLRSREAREHESTSGDVYQQVYEAERPEIFSKATGWRVVGDGDPIQIRTDSTWNVPEPELVIVLNQAMEIVGYCAGNDVSSRSIEGENPLYLPQAKIFDGSCALGPGIHLAGADEVNDVPIKLVIQRSESVVFEGESSTSQMKRKPAELTTYLGRELTFPDGAFLMTGTGIVPPDEFTLQPDDLVKITVGDLVLTNPVAS